MDKDKLFSYHQWAVQESLNHVQSLGEDLYRRKGVSSFSSIEETAGHMITVEKLWFMRMTGKEKPKAEHFDVSTIEKAKKTFMLLHAEMELYFATLAEEQWQETMKYMNMQGDAFENTREEMLFSFINHASYHRGQITSLLRQFGKEGTLLDYMYFNKKNR